MFTAWRAALLLLVMATALLWGGRVHAQASAHASADTPAALAARLDEQGALNVIVTLDMPWDPAVYAAEVQAAAVQEAAIAQNQTAVLSALAGQDVATLRRFSFVPQMALRINSRVALDALLAAPGVAAVQEDVPVPPLLSQTVPLVRGELAHTAGFTGAGWTVAVLDTGVDKNHPKLQGKVVSEACYSTTNAASNFTSVCPSGQDSVAFNSGLNCPVGISGCDHGTHVADIVAGVAPGASIIAVQVFSRVDDVPGNTPCANAGRPSPCTLANNFDIIDGLERVFALRQSYNIAAVNMSLGAGRFGGTCDNDFRKASIDLLRGVGIATVIAAGNSGYTDAMAAPACISSSISVASSDKNNSVSSFSNINNFTTVIAPGGFIRAALPGTQEGFKSGTSMAAPHVAGAVALLRQAGPDKTVDFIKAVLEFNGPPVTDGRVNGFVTKRRLDVYSALCGTISCGFDDFQTLTTPSTTPGIINQAGDRDFFFVERSAGSRLTIQMDATSGGIDPYLEIYTPTGQRIALNDNGGSGSNALINGITLPSTGRYMIMARSVNNNEGNYSLTLSEQTVNVSPQPVISYLVPASATGTFNGADFWVRIEGRNFSPTSRAYLDGSPRITYYSSPTRIWIRMRSTDIGRPWPAVKQITVNNPAPGGTSVPQPFGVTFPFLGESELIQPSVGTTLETGVKHTFVLSWTTPITIPSWRSMQFMDLRLRDNEGNVAAWVRVREYPGENSTYQLVNGADISGSALVTGTAGITETVLPPDEGLPGEDRDLSIPGYVTLHLAESAFSGSGRTAVMTPTLTFQAGAIGTYNVEFRVDNEDGAVQDDDVLGQVTIVNPACPAPVGSVTIDGPSSGTVNTDYVYTAVVSPLDATQPVTYTWSPEPASGQGTTTAVYRWEDAGKPLIVFGAENCGAFSGDVKEVAIRTTETPDLTIAKHAPAVVAPGEPVTYTLTVTNSGMMTATNLEITDVLPAYATYVGGGMLSDGLIAWNVPALGGYGSTAQVQFAVTATRTITNSIIGVSADGDYSTFRTDPVVTVVADDTAALDGVSGGMLNSASATVDMPPGSVADPAVFALDESDTAAYPMPNEFTRALRTYDLAGYRANTRTPGLGISETISMTLSLGGLQAAAPDAIAPDAIAPDAIAPDAIARGLFYWNGSEWSNEGVDCTGGDSTLDCTIDTPSATQFALLEITSDPPPPPSNNVYLPLLQRAR